MMTQRKSPRLVLPKVLIAVALAAAASSQSQAASLTWDASGTSPTAPTDGAGTWSTSNVNWAGGGVDSAWNNGANNDAVFSGTGAGGAITLSTAITANSITVSKSGYSFSGSLITLTSGTFNNSQTVTVNSSITGANGLTKAGAGTLVLGTTGSPVNTYTGTTRILAGSLQPRVASAIPTSTVLAIGTVGSSISAQLDIRANITIAGLAAVGSTPSSNVVTQSQTTGTQTLTVDPDGAGVAAADSTFSGVLRNGDATHVLALTKAGSHTLTLTGVNTYTGTTTVTAGTLIVNGALSTSSGVSVASVARLGGTGTIGSVSVSGTIGGGTGSIGTLNTNDLTLNATGALENEFGRSGVTPTSDLINVTGAVSLANGSNLQLSLSGSTPVTNDIFFLLNNDSTDAVNGVFTKLNGVTTTLTQGSLFTFNSQNYQITYTADFGTSSFTGGNDIAIQVVPEPATCALIGLGAAALLLRRRRSA